jgi:hypothetical protein
MAFAAVLSATHGYTLAAGRRDIEIRFHFTLFSRCGCRLISGDAAFAAAASFLAAAHAASQLSPPMPPAAIFTPYFTPMPPRTPLFAAFFASWQLSFSPPLAAS